MRRTAIMFTGNVVLRTKLVKDIEKPEGIVSYLEDKYLLMYALRNSNTVLVTKLGFYKYMQRGTSSVEEIVMK